MTLYGCNEAGWEPQFCATRTSEKAQSCLERQRLLTLVVAKKFSQAGRSDAKWIGADIYRGPPAYCRGAASCARGLAYLREIGLPKFDDLARRTKALTNPLRDRYADGAARSNSIALSDVPPLQRVASSRLRILAYVRHPESLA